VQTFALKLFSMTFSPELILTQLKTLPQPQRYCVAFSGGCDSHVLLWSLAAIRQKLPCYKLHAIHINHGLHSQANEWEAHCIDVGKSLDVPVETCRVEIELNKGHSLEAQARDARYDALKRLMHPGDMLLLAHHQDDQAETLMLQLIRGAGVHGLAAMPALADFAKGWLARPMLNVPRQQILAFAKQQTLDWIEDPSNRDMAFDRNYLRHTIMPMLTERWPATSATLTRAAMHQAEAATLLNTVAHDDLQRVSLPAPDQHDLPGLLKLPRARQVNLLRYWIRDICGYPLPNTSQLERILSDVLHAGQDKSPVVNWLDVEMRRYRERLYLGKTLVSYDVDWQAKWTVDSQLALPVGGKLITRECEGRGIHKDCLASGIMVRFRRGGEICKPAGRDHHHELRKLFQEWGVPPWLRDRIPLIYAGDELVQVVGYTSCAPFAVKPGETGVEFTIQH
jgi:tRNA(Ile)-lysidine synthase